MDNQSQPPDDQPPTELNLPKPLTFNADEFSTPPTGSNVSPELTPKRGKKWLWALLVMVILAGGGVAYWRLHTMNQPNLSNAAAKTNGNTSAQTSTSAASVQGLQLDTKKNYGNKYANGLLPVGDGKYSSSAPAVGTVYACSSYAQNLSSGQGGASTRGPWFTDNNTEYDITKKVHVSGSVMWSASFTDTVSGDTRTIITNDLPDHGTGVFPILASDAAYAYDRNPNSIKAQSLTYSLNANPAYGSPNCMGGEAGIMLTGVALFNAFDAGGRDAGAWEVQDSCSGHPQSDGIYHYHTLSSCIKDTSVHTVIGYALDGFPITGPQVGPNNILTTSDLDVCHGLTSTVTVGSKTLTTYHYVMTQDFPYSVSCFRGTAIQPPDLSNHSSNTGQTSVPPSNQQVPPNP